ncbi:hypothetical protein N8Z24_00295 [bacterium]|nr:hypothetical protein [bacterium]
MATDHPFVVRKALKIEESTTVDAVLDEDNMASDSATSLATQQSIKYYVDNKIYTADQIEMDEIGTATYDDVQDWSNVTQSAGIVSGGVISDGGSGTIDISAMTGIIKTTNSELGANVFFDFGAVTGQALTDEAANYIGLDYNSGTPQLTVSLSNLANGHDIITVGRVFREGNSIDIMNTSLGVQSLARRVQRRFLEGVFLEFISGGVVSESGTRNVDITAGIIYFGLNRLTSDAVDTSATHDITGGGTGGTVSANNTIVLDSGEGDVCSSLVSPNYIIVENSSNGNDGTYHVSSCSWDGTNTTLIIQEATLNTGADTGNIRPDAFEYYYYNGAAWVETVVTQIDNVNYNDTASGLVALGSAKYGVHWVYKGTNGTTFVIYGQDSYSLSGAQDVQPPSSLPDHVATFGVLRAKIIILKNAASFLEIQNVTDTTFTSVTPTLHNELGGIQGGTANEYYHLTSSDYTTLRGGSSDASSLHNHDSLYYIDKIIEGDTSIEVVDTGTDGHAIVTIDGSEAWRFANNGSLYSNSEPTITVSGQVRSYALMVSGDNAVPYVPRISMQCGNSFASLMLLGAKSTGSLASLDALADTDAAAAVEFLGWASGGSYRTLANIVVSTDGTPTSTQIPAAYSVYTTDNIGNDYGIRYQTSGACHHYFYGEGAAPTQLFEVDATNSFLVAPSRAGEPSVENGAFFYDSTATTFKFGENGSWVSLFSAPTFIGLTDTPGSYTTSNAIYTTNGTPDAVIETTVVLTEGTNTFNIAKGTASLDVAAGAAFNIDASCTIDQDLQQSADVTFDDLTLTGDILQDSTNFHYFGPSGTNGSFRIGRKVSDQSTLVIEMRISGSWVEIHEFDGAATPPA